jgi:hypothetical protein
MVGIAGMSEEKTVADLNPRAQAVKSLETTIVRALALIEEFDKLEPDQDWSDVPGAAYRRIIGERYEYGRLLEEVYNRWKGGTLYREVLDLYENLPPAAQERKEIKNAISGVIARLDSRHQKPAARPATGRRPRQQRLF